MNNNGKIFLFPLVWIVSYELLVVNLSERFIFFFSRDYSEHSKELPIIFLFGVATTVSAVHSSLPHSVAARLSIEKFQALPSLVCLTEVVDKVGDIFLFD